MWYILSLGSLMPLAFFFLLKNVLSVVLSGSMDLMVGFSSSGKSLVFGGECIESVNCFGQF